LYPVPNRTSTTFGVGLDCHGRRQYDPGVATEGQTSGPSGAAYLRLILLAAPIGIPAALVAAVFLALVHWLEDWLWTRPASPAGELVASVVSGARSAGDRRRYRHRRPDAASR
jgi:hypothetical protein